MYQAVNRGWLKKQIEKGNIEARCRYHYTDDYAYDNAVGFGTMPAFKPARIRHPRFETCTLQNSNVIDRCVDDDLKDGFVNFDESDFGYKSGAAYRTEEMPDNEITLRITSNEVWTLRVKK